MSYRLGILCSHPIQYYPPIFRELAKHLDLQVFYAYQQTSKGQADAGFNVPFEWDIDLLKGYKHTFLKNVAQKPDPSHFFGCDTPDIAEEIKQGGFDAFLVLGWSLKSYWQAIRACRRLKLPVMVRGDSRIGTSRSFMKRVLKKLLYPILLRQFDACLYVGNDSRKYYETYGVSPEKLFFSPHSIDNERFRLQADSFSKSDAQKRFGLDTEKFQILFVGKFIPKKRPMDMLQAVARLTRTTKEVSVVLAGDGPLREELEAFAREQSLDLRVLGFINQSDLPLVYRAADVLVLPSEGSETWGLVVNEAMACGVPAITSDAVGCSDNLVVSGKTGKVFEIGNIEALADALQEVLSAQLSPQEIKQFINGYSPARTADGILSAVQSLAAKNSGSQPRKSS